MELKNMMYSAMMSENGPYIIRYPRGYGEGTPWKDSEYKALSAGQGEKILDGEKIAVICAGPFCYRAKEAAEKILKEKGWTPAIYNIRYLKPLDEKLLDEIFKNFERIITVEDGTILGGLYGAVTEYASQKEYKGGISGIGIPDEYINQGTQEEQREHCGLSNSRIFTAISKEIEKIS